MEAKKIIDYKLVRMGFSYENTQVMFEKEVLELIKKGYIPQVVLLLKKMISFKH